MRLEIENIGMISKAEIDLKKISVIAGENDTGKSTIGKVLYSLVYGVNTSSEVYEEIIQSNVKSLLSVIRKKLYNTIDFDYKTKETFEMFKNGTLLSLREEKEKQIDKIIKPLSNLMESAFFLHSSSEEEDEWKVKFDKGFEMIENKLKTTVGLETVKEDLRVLRSYRDLQIATDFIEKTGIQSILLLEFKEQIGSIFSDKIGIIKFYYEKNKILDLQIAERNKFKWNSKLKKIYSKDVVYIESPFIFTKLKDEDTEKRLFKKMKGEPELYSHTDNLKEKLNSLKENKYTKFFISEIENKISENINLEKTLEKCMNGKIKYSEDDEDFVLIKNDKKIAIENVATGIKSFGLINLVLEAGYLKDDNILILDEPEVHLHPKWQIEYAKLIAELAKNLNIRILITSHSPYFIEAIEKYSRKFGLADETNFYLSQKSEEGNSAVIENVNNNIEKIFNTLADAYDKLDEDIIGDL